MHCGLGHWLQTRGLAELRVEAGWRLQVPAWLSAQQLGAVLEASAPGRHLALYHVYRCLGVAFSHNNGELLCVLHEAAAVSSQD